MKKLILVFGILTSPAAYAGCRCGGSYINEGYTCHKCVCECPKCDYRDCRMPGMLDVMTKGTSSWAPFYVDSSGSRALALTYSLERVSAILREIAASRAV